MPDRSIRGHRVRVTALVLSLLMASVFAVVARQSWTSTSADSQLVSDERQRLAYLGPLSHLIGALTETQSAAVRGAPVDNADRLAAIASAFISLANGTSTVYDLGATNKVVVDMDKGFVLVSAISSGSVLGVLASRSAKLGTLGYEMTMFANRTASVLTPQLIEELKASVES